MRPDCLVWLRASEDSLDPSFGDLGLPVLHIPAVAYGLKADFSEWDILPELYPGAWLILPSRRAAEFWLSLCPDGDSRLAGIACVGQNAPGLLKSLNLEVRSFPTMGQLAASFESRTAFLYMGSSHVRKEDREVLHRASHQVLFRVLYDVEELKCQAAIQNLYRNYQNPGFLVLAPSQVHCLNPQEQGVLFCMGRRSFETLLSRGFSRVYASDEPNLSGLRETVARILDEELCR